MNFYIYLEAPGMQAPPSRYPITCFTLQKTKAAAAYERHVPSRAEQVNDIAPVQLEREHRVHRGSPVLSSEDDLFIFSERQALNERIEPVPY